MITRRAAVRTAGASVLASTVKRAKAAAVTVETQYGMVAGIEDDGVRVFKGIPYGASTSGVRFAAPKPPAPWTGVKDATAYGPMSPQIMVRPGPLYASWTIEQEMSEDCLVLNIWAATAGIVKRRPVMVFLHGGDFSSQSGASKVSDGTRLARDGDVVVVTLNHRLNIFGYLFLDQIAPKFAGSGNTGMLDIVAALTWVKANIAAFGGDPDNVTIFGQSGGGAKVTTLMAMPAAQGLFHKAIVQSGSYYLQAMSPDEGTALAHALLAALEIPPANAEILTTQPLDRLLSGLQKVTSAPGAGSFRPVVDGRILPAGPFNPAAPPQSARVPMMIGTTATEMSAVIGERDPTAFDLDEATLKTRLAGAFPGVDPDKIIARFRTGRPQLKAADIYFALASDTAFRDGAWHQAERKVAQKGAPVWLYELDWKSPVDGGRWGSPHALCLPFVFDNLAVSASMVGNDPDAQALADQMSSAWIAFAQKGNPNHQGVPLWPYYNTQTRPTMVFNTMSKLVNDHRGDERTFLASLPRPTH